MVKGCVADSAGSVGGASIAATFHDTSVVDMAGQPKRHCHRHCQCCRQAQAAWSAVMAALLCHALCAGGRSSLALGKSVRSKRIVWAACAFARFSIAPTVCAFARCARSRACCMRVRALQHYFLFWGLQSFARVRSRTGDLRNTRSESGPLGDLIVIVPFGSPHRI